MQVGVGILGASWDLQKQLARMRQDTRPARGNFYRHAYCYASKLAADTILAEPPVDPDLSDEGLIQALGNCALTPRPSEFPVIRRMFRSGGLA